MSDFVPGVEDVRTCYALSGDGLDFRRSYWERREDFDRWLAQHDADLIAQARAEGAAEALRGFDTDTFAQALGGDKAWLTTAAHVGDLVRSWLDEAADDIVIARTAPVEGTPSPADRQEGDEEVRLCPECDLPEAIPGEGRFCDRCQDYEGTCRDDHCMTCGAGT